MVNEMNYKATPLQSGTRLRVDHSTYTTVLLSDLSPADALIGSEVWTATADGANVKAGDKWLHVVSRNGIPLAKSGWVAIVYMGKPVCSITEDTPAPVPTPTPTPTPDPFPKNLFPDTFTMVYPDETKAFYKFEKIL